MARLSQQHGQAMFRTLHRTVAIILTLVLAPMCDALAQSRANGSDDSNLMPPVWKTISLGAPASRTAFFEALDAAGIRLGDTAEEILHRPAFTVSQGRTDVQLVVLSAAQLGFGAQGAGAAGGATLAEIFRRAGQRGLELCPAEVGAQLRLQYRDQPIGQVLHVAMRPIATYEGDLVAFSLANGGEGLVLVGFDGRPDQIMPPQASFVFVRPVRLAQPAAPR
jgi:hypothetical protein